MAPHRMRFSLRKLFKLRFGQVLPPEWLVVGIGNPGDRYRHTRHNAGWDASDEFAHTSQTSATKGSGARGSAMIKHVVWDSKLVVVAKPTTFVNASGRPVVKLLRHYRLQPTQMLVLCDDIHLASGQIRIRPTGGAGGHNGLKSIINALGTDRFARIRIGVGLPPSSSAQINYVLGRPKATERRLLQTGIRRCALAVQSLVSAGLEQTMNEFNSST